MSLSPCPLSQCPGFKTLMRSPFVPPQNRDVPVACPLSQYQERKRKALVPTLHFHTSPRRSGAPDPDPKLKRNTPVPTLSSHIPHPKFRGRLCARRPTTKQFPGRVDNSRKLSFCKGKRWNSVFSVERKAVACTPLIPRLCVNSRRAAWCKRDLPSGAGVLEIARLRRLCRRAHHWSARRERSSVPGRLGTRLRVA